MDGPNAEAGVSNKSREEIKYRGDTEYISRRRFRLITSRIFAGITGRVRTNKKVNPSMCYYPYDEVAETLSC